MQDKIRHALESALEITELDLRNDSGRHAGHAGDDGSGQTHFQLKIAAKDFIGLTRVQRQRMIYGVLQPLFSEGLHALAIEARAPSE